MTDEEYGEDLLKKAKEINFQMDVCLQDISWIRERIQVLYDKVLVDPISDREASLKELNFLIQKRNINLAARNKLKEKSHQLGLLINGFFKQNLWKEL